MSPKTLQSCSEKSSSGVELSLPGATRATWTPLFVQDTASSFLPSNKPTELFSPRASKKGHTLSLQRV